MSNNNSELKTVIIDGKEWLLNAAQALKNKFLVPKKTFKLGNKFRHKLSGIVYILAETSVTNHIGLVDIENGELYGPPQIVKDLTNITEEEFATIGFGIGGPDSFQKCRIENARIVLI